MALSVDQIYLSMQNPDTGEYLLANVYTVDGVYETDGVTPRLLSIGQLVMALCLQRASELETDIVKKMNTLEDVTEMLECMTEIETNVLEGEVDMMSKKVKYHGNDYAYADFLETIVGMTDVPHGKVNVDSTDFLTALESEMDSNNSFSQQTMIQLQSQTTKRDQAYDMISNVLKSLNNVLTGTANNM